MTYWDLRAEIDANRTGVLPPMAVLARNLGVSQATVWRAARRLRSEGKLAFRRGGKVLVPGKVAPPPPPPPSPRESLYQGLRTDILTDRYHAGEALPKLRYLAHTGRVSVQTAARVCARLVGEGLAHRRGKILVAGPAPDPAPLRRPLRTIIVITARSPDWRMLGESRRVSEFCRSFAGQADKCGVALAHACTQPNERYPELDLPHGRAAAIALAKGLGAAYLGALVCADRSEVNDLETWFSALARLGRPVVWFNRFAHPLRAGFSPPGFFRCVNDDSLAAEAAIAHLAGLGHRRAGFAYRPHDAVSREWMARRAKDLESACASHPSGLSLLQAPAGPVDWGRPEALEAALDQVAGLGLPPLRRALDAFSALAPRDTAAWRRDWPGSGQVSPRHRNFLAFSRWSASGREVATGAREAAALVWTGWDLLPCLRDPDLTAIIAANDAFALAYQRWFRAVGLAVPGRYSLLGFDNAFRLGISTLSTVDFGFDLQGYRAFHVLLGDLALSPGAGGRIQARPVVVPRGSTGAPHLPARALRGHPSSHRAHPG